MTIYEYIKIPFRWIPEEIRLQYNLYSLVDDHGYVYCEKACLALNKPLALPMTSSLATLNQMDTTRYVHVLAFESALPDQQFSRYVWMTSE